MIPLDWYRNFVAVYRAGSVSGAARARHLSQPAVSQALAALESVLATPLFERTARGMRPTARGEALYAGVFDAIDRLDALSRSMLPQTEAPPTFRIGSTPEYFHEFVLERLAPLGLSLTVALAPERDLLAAVETGALDGALTRLVPGRGLTHRALGEQPFVLIAGADFEFVGETGDLADRLNALPWVSYSEERPATRRFFSQTLGRRFAATPRLVVPDLRSVVRAVELGFGVSIVPEYACRRLLRSGAVRRLLPLDLPSERWTLAYRNVDADRSDLATIGGVLSTSDA